MSGHTPEPWTFNKNDLRGFDFQIRAAEGVQIGETQELLGKKRALANPAENARRIVACVNACAGIPTETLEETGSFPEAAARELKTLKQQRDRLLEEIKRVLAALPTTCLADEEVKEEADELIAELEANP